MRKNKEIRKTVNENYKPLKGKLMLYVLVYMLISVALAFIPVVGQAASTIFSGVCAIGVMATIIHVYNGEGEKESPVSFFSHTGKLFTNYFCSNLWILLKCIVGIIITVIGAVVMFVSGGSVLAQSIAGGANSIDPNILMNAGIGVIIGMIIYFIGIIVTYIISLKYGMVSYEIIHDNKSGKRAKELVEEAKEHLKGHVGQYFCMSLYYGLLVFCIAFVLTIVVGVIAGLILGLAGATSSAVITLVVQILDLILVYGILLYFIPKLTCSFEELYKDLIAEKGE